MNKLNNLIKQITFTAVMITCGFAGIIVGTGFNWAYEYNHAQTLESMGYKPEMHGMTCYVPINGMWARCKSALFFSVPIIK